ncbi:MAG: ABC transporter ATP-binding protein [Planctomycetota bacterium]
MQPIIQLRNVSKSYRGIQALRGVDVDIPPGVIGLLGPNGSGKSTLIKGLLGLLRFNVGSATVLGLSLPKQRFAIRRSVGYLPEDDCYIAGLTGIESVAFMAKLSGLSGPEGLRRSHEILDFADLHEERYRPVESYSTGMRQKLKFAQAMVHDPDLLIMDEPTTGLDPNQRVAMLERIRTLARKHRKSVLVSTHILHDVQTTCDHVVILTAGQIVRVDSLDNLSRPAQAGWAIETCGPADAFFEALTDHAWTVSRRGDGSIWVSRDGAESPDEIWSLAAQHDVAIASLQPARNSLEQIFFETVRDASETPLANS